MSIEVDKDNASRAHSYLETLVSKTKKFKVEDLLDLYGVYDDLVINFVFRHLLFPYVRFSRTWVSDQARELLAGTDRNRLILTSRFRKATEADYESVPPETKAKWAKQVKPRHTKFLSQVYGILSRTASGERFFSAEDIESLGVSRLVYDDMGSYFNALMKSYPEITADYCAVLLDGDHESAVEIDAYLRSLEAEVGVRREHAWYVTVNVRSIYEQIEKMVQAVTMAYARLLFRFAHSLRGVTSTAENFSAGYEGMIRAARNYDPVDGSAFSSHCQWWARSAILQRQKQSSVISLPNTTWYRLRLVQRGQVDMSSDRVSSLRERAEMFYTSSSNVGRGHRDSEEADAPTFESIEVTSADARVVLGDSVDYAQSIVEGYETRSDTEVGHARLEMIFDQIMSEDPSMVFPIYLWALNEGIDASLLAGLVSKYLLNERSLAMEATAHRSVRDRCSGRTL